MILSLVIRTLNTERYLAELLAASRSQEQPPRASLESVLIESRSTDSSWPTHLVQPLLNGGVSARLHDPA